uniref:Secreted protein n=1 Tax=Arundo donax TaxID=35708 RepID=A0A0A9HCN2_ARUDO
MYHYLGILHSVRSVCMWVLLACYSGPSNRIDVTRGMGYHLCAFVAMGRSVTKFVSNRYPSVKLVSIYCHHWCRDGAIHLLPLFKI